MGYNFQLGIRDHLYAPPNKQLVDYLFIVNFTATFAYTQTSSKQNQLMGC